MEFITSRNINHALVDVIERVIKVGHGITVRENQQTTEICPVVVNIEQPLERCLVNAVRKNNIFAAIAETMWVMAGRNDLDFLSNYLPRATDFSDDGKTWRAAYGSRLRHYKQIDQIQEVYKILKKDPSSRRAVMTIFDPSEDFVESRDIPCNNWLHFMIRDGVLHLDVAVRSNDAIWGFSAINVFEWSVLLEMMAHWLHCGVGRLTFFTSSMHIYDRHTSRANNILSHGVNDIYENNPTVFSFATEIDDFNAVSDQWFEIESEIRKQQRDMTKEIEAFPDELLRGYLYMMGIYWSFKSGASDQAVADKLMPIHGSDLGLAAQEYITRVRPGFGKVYEERLQSKNRPIVILVEGADQTGKTMLINRLISKLGEENCFYIHNVAYRNFKAAHQSVLDVVRQVHDKRYVIVDRWHLSHIIYGQAFYNGEYDEWDPLFSDIDSEIDMMIVCATDDYRFDSNLRREHFLNKEKQAEVNNLFLRFLKHSADKRFFQYDYKRHFGEEKLDTFVSGLTHRLEMHARRYDI